MECLKCAQEALPNSNYCGKHQPSNKKSYSKYVITGTYKCIRGNMGKLMKKHGKKMVQNEHYNVKRGWLATDKQQPARHTKL